MSRRSVLAAGVAAVFVAAGAVWLRSGARVPPPRPAVLVVGDSLVDGAVAEIMAQGPPGQVSVLASSGASPCDVWNGYRPDIKQDGGEISFRATEDLLRPRAVVLAFSGNAGIKGSECFTAGTNYPLSGLVSAYRRSLDAMGGYAATRGAAVYLAAVPPRNPGVGEGWTSGVQRGFNGDPSFNVMLSALAGTRGWTYAQDAAHLLSTADGTWSLRLPCVPADAGFCVAGTVQVRFGNPDPIHFDRPGTNGPRSPSAGGLRFAYGLLDKPLADQGILPRGLS